MTVGDPPSVARRAPFSDNPVVGRRGRRTQQRILDATLDVLAEQGYQRASVDRITRRAGCSRVAFYQYFASKDAAVAHLGAQLTAEIEASVDLLDPLGPDETGWAAVRRWVTAYGDIHARYGPLFHALEAMVDDGRQLEELRRSIIARNVARVRSHLPESAAELPALEALIELLLEMTGRAYNFVTILRTAAPEAYPRESVEDALADVVHRSLFGLRPQVNVHEAGPAAPFIALDPAFVDAVRDHEAGIGRSDAARATIDALLAAGRAAFESRGYFNTRVDDIAAAAGVSHGAFYRYFRNKAEFARDLVLHALRPLLTAVQEIPTGAAESAPSAADLRTWLERYNALQVGQGPLVSVWMDAARHDPDFGMDAAGALDWARRRNVAMLRHRGFGDAGTDSVAMTGLLNAFAARPADEAWTTATLHIIDRGLLGR